MIEVLEVERPKGGPDFRYHCKACGSKGMHIYSRAAAQVLGEGHRKRCPILKAGSYFFGGKL